jgi:transcriptional regulator with XRE-family HTH domain
MQAMTSTNDETTPFAKRLSKARTWAQFSQGDLAEILGVHKRSVGNYETGERMPPTDITVQWSIICGVDLGWLLSAPDLSGPNQGHPLTVIEGRGPKGLPGQRPMRMFVDAA